MQKGKNVMRNALVVIITIILLSPIFNIATAQAISNEETVKRIPVIVKIFTLHTTKEIKKPIDKNDIDSLISLKNYDEYNLIKGLKCYGLIGNMSDEEIIELLHGKYQKSDYANYSLLGHKGLYNALCSINATGYFSMYPMVFMNTMFISHHLFFLLYVLGLLPEWFVDLFDKFWEIVYPPVISLFDSYSSLPKKPPLFRGYLCGNNMTLKTKGIFGVKERNGGAQYRIRGFTGLWITDTSTNYSIIRGFALSVVQAG